MDALAPHSRLHAALTWCGPALAAAMILAVAWALWPALRQEQRLDGQARPGQELVHVEQERL